MWNSSGPVGQPGMFAPPGNFDPGPQGNFGPGNNLGQFGAPQGPLVSPHSQLGPPQGQFGPPPGQSGPPPGQFGPPPGQPGPPPGQFGPPPGQPGPQQSQFGPQQGQLGPPPGQFEPPQNQLRSLQGQFGPPQGQMGPPPNQFVSTNEGIPGFNGNMPLQQQGPPGGLLGYPESQLQGPQPGFIGQNQQYMPHTEQPAKKQGFFKKIFSGGKKTKPTSQYGGPQMPPQPPPMNVPGYQGPQGPLPAIPQTDQPVPAAFGMNDGQHQSFRPESELRGPSSFGGFNNPQQNFMQPGLQGYGQPRIFGPESIEPPDDESLPESLTFPGNRENRPEGASNDGQKENTNWNQIPESGFDPPRPPSSRGLAKPTAARTSDSVRRSKMPKDDASLKINKPSTVPGFEPRDGPAEDFLKNGGTNGIINFDADTGEDNDQKRRDIYSVPNKNKNREDERNRENEDRNNNHYDKKRRGSVDRSPNRRARGPERSPARQRPRRKSQVRRFARDRQAYSDDEEYVYHDYLRDVEDVSYSTGRHARDDFEVEYKGNRGYNLRRTSYARDRREFSPRRDARRDGRNNRTDRNRERDRQADRRQSYRSPNRRDYKTRDYDRYDKNIRYDRYDRDNYNERQRFTSPSRLYDTKRRLTDYDDRRYDTFRRRTLLDDFDLVKGRYDNYRYGGGTSRFGTLNRKDDYLISRHGYDTKNYLFDGDRIFDNYLRKREGTRRAEDRWSPRDYLDYKRKWMEWR